MTHANVDERYFDVYNKFQSHESILRDRPCLSAYHDAIMSNRHLFENKVVLDVGSGTGVLSLFAAKAGAKYVYAVDSCSSICCVAEELVQSNHLQDRIEVINKRIEDIVAFREKIDIIISEWMGSYLFHKSILESIIYAREHFLHLPATNDDMTPEANESIIIFPSHAYLYCAPFFDEHIRIELNTMWKDYFDLNMSPILSHIKNSDLKECVFDTIDSSQLVHDAQLIQSIDLRTVRIEDLRKMRSFCEFNMDNTCIISGFCFWFDCYFSSNNNSSILRSTRLTTSPFSPKTHWKQTLVFLPNDIYPLKGDMVPVSIKIKRKSNDRQQYDLSISIKKIKEGTVNNILIDDDHVASESYTRRRHRRRSSTISSDRRNTTNDKIINKPSDTESSNSDDDTDKNEHPIPCLCDRDRCKLVKTIIETQLEENIIE